MAHPDPLMSKTVQALRAAALRHADVEEAVACKGTAVESASFKVRKKAFLFLSASHARVKLDASIAKARKLGCDVGKLGWVKVDLVTKTPPLGTLRAWIAESYRLMS
jgi:hypothetical protein